MHFGAERCGQGEVERTSWRHWANHVRSLRMLIHRGFNPLVKDPLREQGSRVQ